MALRGLKLRKRRKNDQKWPKMTILRVFKNPCPQKFVSTPQNCSKTYKTNFSCIKCLKMVQIAIFG